MLFNSVFTIVSFNFVTVFLNLSVLATVFIAWQLENVSEMEKNGDNN